MNVTFDLLDLQSNNNQPTPTCWRETRGCFLPSWNFVLLICTIICREPKKNHVSLFLSSPCIQMNGGMCFLPDCA